MNEALKQFTDQLAADLKAKLAAPEMAEYVAKMKSAGDDRTFEVVMSTADEDRQGDELDQSKWELKFYDMNPVVLWAHNYQGFPIGIVTDIKTEGDKTIATGKFAPEGVNPEADMACKLYQEKILRAVSPGYIQNDDGTRELLELSFCPVPAGRYALSLRQVGRLGVSTTELITKGFFYEAKGAVPYADHGTEPEDTEWDGPAQVKACGKDLKKLKAICAWFDSEDADVKSSYKLPHHNAETLKANWNGVKAAMGALKGARGGVDIPEANKKAVEAHLLKHYKQFGKEPPEKSANGDILMTCEVCHSQYKVYPSEISTRKYCGQECAKKALAEYLKTTRLGSDNPNYKDYHKYCEYCGEQIPRTRRSKSIYCSLSCMGQGRLGANNPAWRDTQAMPPPHINARSSKEYCEWRAKVYERDNFTCQRCGLEGGDLEAHHILTFSEYPAKRYEVSNGLTLCEQCHDEFHAEYGVHGAHLADDLKLFVRGRLKAEEPGDECEMDDGSPGVLAEDPKNPGRLVCVPKEEKSESHKPMKKELIKAIAEEDARHEDAVVKAIDDFKKSEPDGDDQEKALDEFTKALDDEHEEHHKAIDKAIDDHYELEDQKSVDEFRKAMDDEHVKHVKALDTAVDAMKKDWPDGDPNEPEAQEEAKKAIDEFRTKAEDELERHTKAHADLMEDGDDKEPDNDADDEKALLDAIRKSGRAISAKNRKKLDEIAKAIEDHHADHEKFTHDVIAALKELSGSPEGDEREEHDPEEKSGSAAKPKVESQGIARNDDSFETIMFGRRVLRAVDVAVGDALGKLNQKLREEHPNRK